MFKRVLTLLATTAAALALVVATGSPASAAIKTYFIDVTTCNELYAGTDANIWISIDGTLGSTGWKLLDNPNKNDFERGQTDFFQVVGDVGVITHVYIFFVPGVGTNWCRSGMTISSVDWWDYRNNSTKTWYTAEGAYTII